MNKKLIVLILFIFLLLSIVVISLFGKKPEPPIQHASNIEFFVETLEPVVDEETQVIYDADIDQESGIITVNIDVTNLEKVDGYYVLTYQLQYNIYPEASIDKRVLINTLHSSDLEYVSISEDGLVTIQFTESTFEKQFEIVIKSLDYAATSGAADKIILNIIREKNEFIPI